MARASTAEAERKAGEARRTTTREEELEGRVRELEMRLDNVVAFIRRRLTFDLRWVGVTEKTPNGWWMGVHKQTPPACRRM